LIFHKLELKSISSIFKTVDAVLLLLVYNVKAVDAVLLPLVYNVKAVDAVLLY